MADGSLVLTPTIVLWDYENASIPSGVSGLWVAQRIQAVFGKSCSIRSILAFGNTLPIPQGIREGLTIGGVKFVDAVATLHRKDVADKLILTEMFLFAMDHPPPANIILISGDIDFSSALAALKNRGYRIILVPPMTVSRQLLLIPHEVIHWNQVVRPVEDLATDGNLRRSAATIKADPSPPAVGTAPSGIRHPPSRPIKEGYESPQNTHHDPDDDTSDLLGDETEQNSAEDLLDVCLTLSEQGLTQALASRVGILLKQKYPNGFYKGQLTALIEEARERGWLTTDGVGGGFTLVFNIEAMNHAWDQLLVDDQSHISSEEHVDEAELLPPEDAFEGSDEAPVEAPAPTVLLPVALPDISPPRPHPTVPRTVHDPESLASPSLIGYTLTNEVTGFRNSKPHSAASTPIHQGHPSTPTRPYGFSPKHRPASAIAESSAPPQGSPVPSPVANPLTLKEFLLLLHELASAMDVQAEFKIFSSQVGIHLKTRYPDRFEKGCIGRLTAMASKRGLITLESPATQFATIICDISTLPLPSTPYPPH